MWVSERNRKQLAVGKEKEECRLEKGMNQVWEV